MERESLYSELSRYYDLIYHNKDYEGESERLLEIIEKEKKSNGKKLLDIGCGTGGHLKYLSDHFYCSGLDLNEGILSVAREKLDGVDLVQGDMCDFKLNRKFDVIISIFGTMGYCRTKENLEKAIENISIHLVPGGLFLMEPWFDKESFVDGLPFMQTYNGEDLKIARVSSSRKMGDLSRIDMHYLIAERGSDVEYFSDVHELGLFGIEDTKEILEKNSFTVRFDRDGIGGYQGLFIASKV